MILTLGVLDIPYKTGGVSTGDVAEILESKYHVMEVFAGTHIDDIANDLADSVAGALETLMAGGPVQADPTIAAMGTIEKRFQDFLTHEEMAGWPGVPTQAALEGRSSRFKGKRGPRRPSLIDTGTYLASFKAWVK